MFARLGWALLGAMLAMGINRLSQRTGVSDAEAFGSLPGDDVIPHPMVEWTRGVTVAATSEAIWPWLVQRGYGRAGWDTPKWIDRLLDTGFFGVRIERGPDDRIFPEHQHLDVGDIIADGPDYAAYFRVLEVEPNRAIVYHSIRHPRRGHPVDPTDPAALASVERSLREGGTYLDFTWTFVLLPIDQQRTRLLVRTRANYSPRSLALAMPFAGLFDATYGVAMLRRIAQKAEGLAPSHVT